MPCIVHRRFGQFDGFIEHHNHEPCVVFRPAQAKRGSTAFGIGLSHLHRYFHTPSALPTKYALKQLAQGCKDMGFSEQDSFAVKKLADALYEMVDELVRAPPEELFPPEKGRPVGEISVVDRSGRTLHAIEIPALRARPH